ncbi:MAG: ABC transporter substrate-binding protein [Treponema sp.]|nr:ABC transporter substrate-binding protein [Treponema sp.]
MKKNVNLVKSLGAVVLLAAMVLSSCAKKEEASVNAPSVAYKDVVLGETGKDLKVTLKLLNHKTDMLADDYPGKNWAAYLKEFNEMYPGIKVEVEGITTYADTVLMRLQGGAWGDIMMIPAVDKKDLSEYFMPFGSLSDMEKEIRFATMWMYDDKVYGVPYMANAQGILYNKKIFRDAGITELPKTPDEYIAALKKVKAKTNAIPLYTNYAAGWTMGAWDAYIAGSATGDADYQNNVLLHESNPFRNYGDGTHAYAVYKILYDAVANGLIEDDYTTTDWEGCKGMMNRGEIATMALGSWAVSQMQGAGPNAADIGYMSFPITVNGKQYATAGGDYCYGINAHISADKQLASLIFVKWLTEKSHFSYNEGGIPISLNDNQYPDLYKSFDGIDFVPDNQAAAGEEDILNKLNADSELNINNGGNSKVQAIIEHAFNKDKDFDQIMNEWNEAWTSAQEKNSVRIN